MPKVITQPGSYDLGTLIGNDGKTIFKGGGTYNVTIDGSLFSKYTLEAKDGATVNVSNPDGAFGTLPHLIVDGASTLSFAEAFSIATAPTVRFTGSGGGTVILPPGETYADRLPSLVGFGPTDSIDFGSPLNLNDQVSYKSTGSDVGFLTLKSSHGKVLGEVKLIGAYQQSDFNLVPGPNGTVEITNTACFLRGTMIAADRGEVLVETLRAGDLVATFANGVKAVKAVRLRSFTDAGDVASAKFRPVCFSAGSLGDGLPTRDLFVSPDHSMYLDGALVPAHLLVNGISITQPVNDSQIDYFHVELEPHDIILAEGAPTESYLDIGNLGHFGRSGVVTLFPETDPKTWEDACAPVVLGGARLARIKARLDDGLEVASAA